MTDMHDDHHFELSGSVSTEELAHLQQMEHEQRAKKLRRRAITMAALAGVLSIGVSIAALVGQSFSYRQAHALEAIAKSLAEGCKR